MWQFDQRSFERGIYRYDEDGELEKRCSKCREYWPADRTCFYLCPGNRDGLHAWCIACYLETRNKLRKANDERRAAD